MLYKDGFSVIASVNEWSAIECIIRNFNEQNFDNKELIIVINKDIDFDNIKKYIDNNENIYAYEKLNLTSGECLNFAIDMSKYKYIAKFDEKYIYSKSYLSEAYTCFNKIKCDVIGKWQYLAYFEKDKKLVAMPKDPRISKEFSYVSWLPSETLCFNKNVFKKIKFVDSNFDIDDDIIKKCINNYLKIFSTSRYNFMFFICDEVDAIKSYTLIKENISLDEVYEYIDKEIY